MEQTERWAKVLKTVGRLEGQPIVSVMPAQFMEPIRDGASSRKVLGQLVLTGEQLLFFRVQRGRSDIVLRHDPIAIDIRAIVDLEVDSDGDRIHEMIIEHGDKKHAFKCYEDSDVVVAFTSALAALSEGRMLPADLPLDQDDKVRVKESQAWNYFLGLIILGILGVVYWLFQWTF